MGVIAPDILLYNTINSLLKFVRVDWENNIDKNNTFLYRVLNGLKIGKYDYYKEAQSVFLCPLDDPRIIEVVTSYNGTRQSGPTIVINMPSEDSNENGMGVDEGYEDDYFNLGTGKITLSNNRRFGSTYSLIVVSENRNETLMVYTMLKALIVGGFDNILVAGLTGLKVSGRDLQMTQDKAIGVFMRAIGISFGYEFTVPKIDTNAIINNLDFKGKPIDE